MLLLVNVDISYCVLAPKRGPFDAVFNVKIDFQKFFLPTLLTRKLQHGRQPRFGIARAAATIYIYREHARD